MIYIVAWAIRKISIFLLSFDLSYYLGMVVVRFGRLLRKTTYKSYNHPDYQKIEMFNKVYIFVDRFTYMGGTIFWTGFHHLNEVLFLNRFLHSEMTFVDIGANQGEFTLLAASKIKTGRILSFEPVSQQRELLLINKKNNNFSNIEIYDFGLGNESNELPIFTSLDTKLHHGRHEGLSSLYCSNERSTLQQLIKIEVFDDLFYEKLTRLDFVKIDIEGAELFALQGMKKSIERFKPFVLIEINEETFNSAGYKTNDILMFFKEVGYSFYSIKRGKLLPDKLTNFEIWGNYIARYDS